MRLAVRWATYIEVNPGKASSWDCVFCESKGLQKERNCDGVLDGHCPKHGKISFEELEEDELNGKLRCSRCNEIVKMPFQLKLGKNFWLWRCPLQEINQQALFQIKIVHWSETLGQPPSGGSLYDESNLYFEIRDLILREQKEAREELEKQHPKTDQRKSKQGLKAPRKARKH